MALIQLGSVEEAVAALIVSSILFRNRFVLTNINIFVCRKCTTISSATRATCESPSPSRPFKSAYKCPEKSNKTRLD